MAAIKPKIERYVPHVCLLCGEIVKSIPEHVKLKHEKYYQPRKRKGYK